MWFGYNPQVILSLSYKLNLVIFQAFIRIKSGKFGHQVNLKTHLQTV